MNPKIVACRTLDGRPLRECPGLSLQISAPEANSAPTSKGGRRLKARLDHLFVLTGSEAQAALPAAHGFSVHRRGPHQGGGSGNVVYRFRNALLELAYPTDPVEIARLGAIGFDERWRWRENGYAPFGVVFRIERDAAGALPFDTWEYAPPFAPRARWTIAHAPPQEPLYMVAPYESEERENPHEPALASISVTCPGITAPSPVARFLAGAGICNIVAGPQIEMELSLDGGVAQSVDMRPGLPLHLRHSAETSVTEGGHGGF